jgi:hypothetical protein
MAEASDIDRVNQTSSAREPTSTGAVMGPMAQLFDRVFFRRVGLAVAAVLLSLQFEWHTLRFLTSEAVLRMSAAFGLPIRRVAFDQLALRDTVIQFSVACTWISGLFGILPLLRMRGPRNADVRRAAIFVLGFFLLNLLRIQLVILIYRPGMSWDLLHGCITGVSEFAVYLWVVSLIDHPLARLLRSGRLPRTQSPLRTDSIGTKPFPAVQRAS